MNCCRQSNAGNIAISYLVILPFMLFTPLWCNTPWLVTLFLLKPFSSFVERLCKLHTRTLQQLYRTQEAAASVENTGRCCKCREHRRLLQVYRTQDAAATVQNTGVCCNCTEHRTLLQVYRTQDAAVSVQNTGRCCKCTEHRTQNRIASCGPCPISSTWNIFCLVHNDISGVVFCLSLKSLVLYIWKQEKHNSASPSGTPREKQRQSFATEHNLDIINLPVLHLENRNLCNIAQNVILSSI